MLEHLTLGEFVVALLMGGAALSAFIWGATSGAFRDIEAIKHQVLHAEDEANEAPRSSGRPPTDRAGLADPATNEAQRSFRRPPTERAGLADPGTNEAARS